MQQRGEINLHLVLTIFLGLGMVLFGVLAVVAYRENTFVTNNLSQLNAKAAAEAADKQKKEDDLAHIKANQEPYRVYTADPVHGGFQLQIPKNWSLYAGTNNSSLTQLDLAANPDVVKMNIGTGAVNTYAFHLQLRKASVASINRAYEPSLKNKTLTSKGVVVSGIQGTWFEGTIDQQRHNGVIVVIPVRDKAMVISTENRNYLNEFNKILSTAKIIP
jgi:hypothetical protein